jgi:hypothetical protein
MPDEEKQAVEEQTPQAGEETSQTPPVETKAPSEETEPASDQKQETETKEEKPSRLERRNQQLLKKLKDLGQQAQEVEPKEAQPDTVSDVLGVENLPPWWQSEQSDLQPDENGFVPLDKLNQSITKRAETIADLKVRQALAQRDAQDKFVRSVEKFSAELEQLQREAPELADGDDYDPEFDKQFSELIVSINSDEKGNFVSKKSPLEVYKALKAATEKARVRGQVESSVKMEQTMADAAVAPTAGSEGRDSDLEVSFREAAESESMEKWAQHLKKRLQKP